MKRRSLYIICIVIASFTIISCKDKAAEPEVSKATAEAALAEQTQNFTTYEEVFNEYSKLIKDLAPALVAEYEAQEKEMNGDMDKLAALCNEKVQLLSVINNEGIENMAKIMQKNGDSYDVYEEWAGKLYDVYMDESSKISNAYMKSFGL